MKRVVVTGMAGVTAFGNDWQSVGPRLREERNAVRASIKAEYDAARAALFAGETVPTRLQQAAE